MPAKTIHRGLLLAAALAAAAGRPQTAATGFRRLTVGQGLSQSWVRAIVQDRRGFMWFGTQDGLNRYDGRSVARYFHSARDTASLSSSAIQSLFEDSRGNLWIGTESGVNRYDRRLDRFVRRASWPPGFITAFAELPGGRLIVTTRYRGLFWFDPESDSIRAFIRDPREASRYRERVLNAVVRDRDGGLWIATNDGLDAVDASGLRCVRYRKGDGGGVGLADDDVRSLLLDSRGRIWAGTRGGGLQRITPDPDHPGRHRFIRYVHDAGRPSGIGPGPVLALLEDGTGALWIGHENGGLDRMEFPDGPDGRPVFVHFTSVPADDRSLSNDSVHSLFQDREGGLWIGTFGDGLNYTHPLMRKFRHVRPSPGGLSSRFVNAFLEEDRFVWIGTESGLDRFDRRTGEARHFAHDPDDGRSIGSDAVWKIFRDGRSDLWIGTWGGGLNLFDGRSGTFTRYRHDPADPGSLSADFVFTIDEDTSGSVWIGTMGGGLDRWNPRDRTFEHHRHDAGNPASLSNDWVSAIRAARDGRIWVSTAQAVDVFDPASGSFRHYRHDPGDPRSLGAIPATIFLEDGRGRMWIGTSDGLNVYNPATDDFDLYDRDQGLPDGQIKGLLEGRAGDLWISTNRGLSRFAGGIRRPAKPVFENYGPEDGLQGNEFIKRSCWKSPGGPMYFGGNNGYNVFNPDSLMRNPFIPQTVLTGFSLFNRPVAAGDAGSPLKQAVGETEEIVLTRRQSVMAFEYASLSYVSPEKNRFAYRMEGFDPEWIEAGTARSATYTNLNPGQYTFRVKGSNNDGLWNEQGASIRVRITPPLWRAAWFRGAGLAAAAGLLFAGMRIRTRRMRRLNRELERRIHERTAELEDSYRELESFSYSVSHDLRAPLRGLNGFSKALLEDYGPRLDGTGRDYLTRIRKASETMGRLIDDLLRLSRLTREGLKPVRVDLSRLAGRLVDEYRQADPDRPVFFVCRPDCVVEGDESLLTILMRNLIDNAWKFSARRPETRIEFGRTQETDTPAFFVRDNGVGFDLAYADGLFEVFQRQHPEFEGVGIGLATVKRIANRHGGIVWAEGAVDGGATFYFTVGRNAPPVSREV
jgi:ligand-binding sensor domain-containing protein/signal transduction histidine kinase